MATDTRDTAKGGRGRPTPGGGRTSPALFYRQVVAELRKVIWPTRKELITYTTVALVFVLIMVGIVLALDFAFGRIVLQVFG